MTGLTALVPLAELLAELAGSRAGAARLAAGLLGGASLARGCDDICVAAQAEMVSSGVAGPAGVIDRARAAELVAVCEILAAASRPRPAIPPEPRLVLSAPPGTVSVKDIERLDGLVLDVIRMATSSLHIGGAFWNDGGFRILSEVLGPAVVTRKVTTVMYVNTPELSYGAVLEKQVAELKRLGPVTVRWFRGPETTMLHAKFVIADRRRGYLGTANLTSKGLRGHVEAGVELTAEQSERFVTFLEHLEAAGLFANETVEGGGIYALHDAALARSHVQVRSPQIDTSAQLIS